MSCVILEQGVIVQEKENKLQPIVPKLTNQEGLHCNRVFCQCSVLLATCFYLESNILVTPENILEVSSSQLPIRIHKWLQK